MAREMAQQERIDLYRETLIALCEAQGGRMVVSGPEHSSGTLFNRMLSDGSVEFVYSPSGAVPAPWEPRS